MEPQKIHFLQAALKSRQLRSPVACAPPATACLSTAPTGGTWPANRRLTPLHQAADTRSTSMPPANRSADNPFVITRYRVLMERRQAKFPCRCITGPGFGNARASDSLASAAARSSSGPNFSLTSDPRQARSQDTAPPRPVRFARDIDLLRLGGWHEGTADNTLLTPSIRCEAECRLCFDLFRDKSRYIQSRPGAVSR